jgi:hypothetical protein
VHPSLFFHSAGLLSQPELSSARIDGVLIEVGEGYMPPDLPEDPAARATSLTPILPPGFALCSTSAAWVHGVGDAPPVRHHIQRVSPQRRRVHPRHDVVIHEGRIGAGDVEVIGGVPVTTPLRTLSDLVRTGGDDEIDGWMRRLAATAPDLVPRVHAGIAGRERMPGKRAALARIAALASIAS